VLVVVVMVGWGGVELMVGMVRTLPIARLERDVLVFCSVLSFYLLLQGICMLI
jgi:hypothetical protein